MLLRADGELLLGYGDGALLRVATREALVPEWLAVDQALGSAIQSLYESSGGVLWLGTHTRGLFRARPLSAAVRRERMDDGDIAAWPGRSVRSFWRDERFELVGTDVGLAMRTADEPKWRTQAAIGATSVRAIVPDGSIRTWRQGRCRAFRILG